MNISSVHVPNETSVLLTTSTVRLSWTHYGMNVLITMFTVMTVGVFYCWGICDDCGGMFTDMFTVAGKFFCTS